MQRQGVADRSLTTRDVVFLIAPCINAAGRLGDPSSGVRLLLTDSADEACALADELIEQNRARQQLDRQVRQEAADWVQEHCDPGSDCALVAGRPSWHVGVVGIVASKLVERFYRPAFLFSVSDDGIAKGSGRSVAGLHLLDALHECREHLISYGGHRAAAGAKLRVENLDAFRRAFNTAVASRLSPAMRNPVVTADAEVRLPALTRKFYDIIDRMAPFGPGNMRPVFLCRDLRHRFKPRVVGKDHLKMAVASEGVMLDAIAFNFGERMAEIRDMDRFALAFTLDLNEWNGRTTLQMKVKGVSA
jgi:single-stranded-DNA-specific exonuclease